MLDTEILESPNQSQDVTSSWTSNSPLDFLLKPHRIDGAGRFTYIYHTFDPNVCWWKKSCTTWNVETLENNGTFTISPGAGFCPSTVWPRWFKTYQSNGSVMRNGTSDNQQKGSQGICTATVLLGLNGRIIGGWDFKGNWLWAPASFWNEKNGVPYFPLNPGCLMGILII